ncbi:myb-like protein D isoform X1 [Bombus bifarius]|uniref:Myb-like protein D isoform X1 n=2 Tax=Bombus bifarius TaxID=103933 RepID=A0A6P8N4D9_9HYME|nr:myb-like protein D isoform X1 [Bombus bifarius]
MYFLIRRTLINQKQEYFPANNQSILFYLGKRSSSRINLNDAMFMSINDEVFSYSDNECFHDILDSSISLRNEDTEIDISVATNTEGSKHISSIFEHNDSTSLFSLPRTKSDSDYVSNNLTNDFLQNSSNLQHQQDMDTEKDNFKTNKDVSLRTLLRQMFDEILGRHDSTKQLDKTYINRHSSNEFLSNNGNLTDKSDSAFEINNNDPVCQTQKFNNMATTSINNINNYSKSKISSSFNTSSLDRFNSEQLITILEDSNESSSNSELNNSQEYSGRCIGKLKHFFPRKVVNKWMSRKIFTTSDISEISDATTMSSNISTDIEILSKEILKKADNVLENRNERFDVKRSSVCKLCGVHKSFLIPFITITPSTP